MALLVSPGNTKAWQCLLSHALTFGPGPQHSSHEEEEEGQGGGKPPSWARWELF